jgi:hypothetical protein
MVIWNDDSILPQYDTVSHPGRSESSATLLPKPHIPEDPNPQLHCCQNLKTHFLENSGSPNSADEGSSLLGSDALPLFEYFATFLSAYWYERFHLLLCFPFTSRPKPSNILESTVGQRDIQVIKLSTLSSTFYSECYSVWYQLESHSSQFYEGLAPNRYPTKIGSGNQMSRIFLNHKTPPFLTMHTNILTQPRYEETGAGRPSTGH